MGFWGSIIGSSGIKKASNITSKTYKKADALVREGDAKAYGMLSSAADYQPAQGALERILGLQGAQAQQDAYGQFRDSPGVSFLRDQGEQSLQRAASAGGQLASGRTLADANIYGQGVAEQSFGDYFNRLRDIYGTKLVAAGDLAAGSRSTYNALADLRLGKGLAKADYAMQKGAIIPNLISQGSQIIGGIAGAALGGPMGGALASKMMAGGSSYGKPATIY